jgi:preprotein translocase subunit SecD
MRVGVRDIEYFLAIVGAALLAAACAPASQELNGTESIAGDRLPLSIGGARFYPSDVRSSDASIDATTQAPVVHVQFTPEGQRKLKAVLRKIGVGHPMPIRLGNNEITRPIVREYETENGVTISGSFSLAQAQDIAAAIDIGPKAAN